LRSFWGWWLAVFTTYALYLLARGQWGAAPDAGFDRQAVAAYLVTALGTIASSLLNGAGDLALIGFFTMTPWAIMGWAKLARRGCRRVSLPNVLPSESRCARMKAVASYALRQQISKEEKNRGHDFILRRNSPILC